MLIRKSRFNILTFHQVILSYLFASPFTFEDDFFPNLRVGTEFLHGGRLHNVTYFPGDPHVWNIRKFCFLDGSEFATTSRVFNILFVCFIISNTFVKFFFAKNVSKYNNNKRSRNRELSELGVIPFCLNRDFTPLFLIILKPKLFKIVRAIEKA